MADPAPSLIAAPSPTTPIAHHRQTGIGIVDYESPPVVIQHDLSRPFPRGTNPAHRHLRNQESRYGAQSKRSLVNQLALALGAPEPPKLTPPNGDRRFTHPDQRYPYDYVDWATMTPGPITEVLAGFRDREMSASTRNAMRVLIRGIATESWMLGRMSHETVDRIKQIKAAKHAKKGGGKAQPETVISALLQLCDRDPSARGFRDGLMLALMTACGLRRVEIVRIELAHIHHAQREIEVLGKGQKHRTVGVPDCVWWRLTTYIARFRGNQPGFLFNPMWGKQEAPQLENLTRGLTVRAINQRLERLRLQLPDDIKISPHDLRRTCGTDLFNAGMSMRQIQVILGHESMSTTERYVFDETDAYRSEAARLQSGRFGYQGA
nr:site-specific integrase [uncultured Halomonas sp.]